MVKTGAADGSRPAVVGGWAEPRTPYFNRELSWLAFNGRVLQLAADQDVPLLERVRFLGIFASNLDEFFQVRVSGLAGQVAAGVTELSADGLSATAQLGEIRRVVLELCEAQHELFVERIRPELASVGIDLITGAELHSLSGPEQAELRRKFEQQILPVLTPLAVDPAHPFPFISDLSLNLAVLMSDPVSGRRRFARVKVPNTLDRWVRVGSTDRFVAQEDVIAAHLDLLFPGMEVLEHHAFRVTRNADFTVDDEGAADLLVAVEMELRQRRFRHVVRLEVVDSVSAEVLDRLQRELDINDDAIYFTPGPVDFGGLREIADLSRRGLHWPPWRGLIEPRLAPLPGTEKPPDFFEVLRRGDVLVHHPYWSFVSSVVELIKQASRDPAVLAIKMTLYRTSGDSPIVDFLIAAAEQGKQVAVLVELKARFDEAVNINWARRLEQAGAHVTYGLIGLKIHAKTAMIVRQEPDGIRRYCHIGTGNYNQHTAAMYEDFGLLTCDEVVGADVARLFNQLTGYGRGVQYDRLMVAPESLRGRIMELIEGEISAHLTSLRPSDPGPDPVPVVESTSAAVVSSAETGPTDGAGVSRGQGGRIIMKMNALVDPDMIEQLYKASQAGVEIDLIVRAQCCLRPGVADLSERIRVRSLVGRYLEHSRVYHFANGEGPGRPATYIGSADLMNRNLDRRVEALVRVADERLAARVMQVVQMCLKDNRLAWALDSSGVWRRNEPEPDPVLDAQLCLQELATRRAGAAGRVLR